MRATLVPVLFPATVHILPLRSKRTQKSRLIPGHPPQISGVFACYILMMRHRFVAASTVRFEERFSPLNALLV
ncbi:hypothetical protein BH10PSE13_BH10PSE13_01280 [soil metagenome]